VDNRPEDRDQVVILFQDMLEVVTRDIMEDQISRCGHSSNCLFKFASKFLSCCLENII
jgi:hypothetical protein